MSLINDALKKAQKQHSQFSSSNLGPALPPGYVPPTAAKTNQGGTNPLRSVLLYLIGAAVLVSISVGITLYILRDEPAASKPAPQASAAPTPTAVNPPAATPTVASAPPRPVVAAQPTPSPAPAIITPPTPTPVPPAAPVTTANEPAPAITPLAPLNIKPVVTPSATETPAPRVAAAAPKPTAADTKSNLQRIQSMVDRLQINSVLVTSTDTKIILNNRLYRLGDTIDHSIGLKITEVHDNHIVFTDSSETKFIKLR